MATPTGRGTQGERGRSSMTLMRRFESGTRHPNETLILANEYAHGRNLLAAASSPTGDQVVARPVGVA